MDVDAAGLRYKTGDMGTRDLLRIVEAAYWVDGTDAEWLERVGEACRPALDEGFGLCVFQFQHQLGSPPNILRAAKVAIPEALAAVYGEIFRRLAPGIQVRPFTHGPCTTGSQMMGQREEFRENEQMKRHVHQFGVYDTLWITAAEPSGSGCGIHSGRPEVGWVSRSFRARWAKVASHLAAGLRLRRRLQSVLEPPQVEAVLEPGGKLLHAEGPATEPEAVEQLRRAVLAVESARSSAGRSDVMTSLDSWQGLIDARWSLLDQFESDGRRFIVARENAPRPPGPAALTQRERQVLGYAAVGHDNKVIAYDLGIAHATVKVLMSRAANKLGVRSRSEVISAYLNACGSAPPAP